LIPLVLSWVFMCRDTYYTYEGDWFTTISFNLGFTKLHFQDERYEFGEYFTSFYQGHFAGGYALESILHRPLGDAALPFTIALLVGWELSEHYILRTCPVSAMDIAWGAMGAFLSDAHRRGNMTGWGFRYEWMILDNPALGSGGITDIYRGQDDLLLLLWCIIPGNYNPYTFGVYHVGQRTRFEVGFSYVPPCSRFPPERPPEGWGVFVWDTRQRIGISSEDLLFPPDSSNERTNWDWGVSLLYPENFCPYFKASFSF